jgi:putative redox protein
MNSEVISAVESGRGAFHLKILAHGVLLEADEPVASGGLGLGLTPTELLCAALAACTTMTLRMYCTRKHWDLQFICTDVTQAPRSVQSSQARFERIIHLGGALSDEQMVKLLAIANRCPVHVTLEAGAQIGTQLRAGAPSSAIRGSP